MGGDKVERVGRRNDNGVKPWLTDEDGAAPAKQEMEVTFASGLEGLGKRILDKRATFKARAGQTLFEQYLQRKKDKKAAQRAVGRVNVDSESDEDGGASSSDGGAGVVAGDSFFDDEGDAAEGGKAEAGFNDDFFNVRLLLCLRPGCAAACDPRLTLLRRTSSSTRARSPTRRRPQTHVAARSSQKSNPAKRPRRPTSAVARRRSRRS